MSDWKTDLQADERAELADLRREAKEEARREYLSEGDRDDDYDCECGEGYDGDCDYCEPAEDCCPICGSGRCRGWNC